MTTLLASVLIAPVTSAVPVDHKVVGVSMFKNGYAVVTRVSDTAPNGVTEIEAPEGVLGSIWIGTSPGVTLVEGLVTNVVEKSMRELGTLDALLTENVGQTLTVGVVQTVQGQPPMLTGTLLSAAGQVVVMQLSDGKTVAFNKAAVQSVVSGGELKYKAEVKSEKRVLRVTTRGAGKLYTTALQRGMAWSPSYQVDITDENKLAFRARAVLLNELAGFSKVDVKLITGFPSIKFLDTLDPFTSAATLAQYMGGLATRAAADARREFGIANQAGAMVGGGGAAVQFGQFDPTGSGQQLEDLFFYTLPGTSLNMGDRLYRPLFQSEADYRHLYRIDLRDFSNWYTREAIGGGMPNDPIETIHVLEFRNTSGQPLTTAPAMVVKSGEVLGQDQIDYTPAGATVELKLGKALDIQSEEVEEELGRERGVIKDRHGNDRQDKLTIKGTVTIVNRTAKTVNLKVDKRTQGELVSADDGGVALAVPSRLGSANPVLHIVWDLKLEPGKTKVVTYTYSMFVPPIG